MVPVKGLLAINSPRSFRLALNASTRPQLILFCNIEWSAWIIALSATQIEAFHLIVDWSSLGHHAIDIHKLVQMLARKLSNWLAQWEGVDSDPQFVFICGTN
jgi:hypothetical protein